MKLNQHFGRQSGNTPSQQSHIRGCPGYMWLGITQWMYLAYVITSDNRIHYYSQATSIHNQL
jgi:hypothetical protein